MKKILIFVVMLLIALLALANESVNTVSGKEPDEVKVPKVVQMCINGSEATVEQVNNHLLF